MRRVVAIALALCALAAPAQQPSAKPRIHALVAAVGNQFQVIYEEKSTGTSLPPFRRRTFEAALTPPPDTDAITWIVAELEPSARSA